MNLSNELFSNLNNLYTQQRELAAIWLLRPLQTANERTVRICPDMLVKVKDGQLIDCNDHKPTHKILACFGTLYDQFELTLIGLEDSQPLQIKI